MVLNAVQNAAKCETKSINIHSDCINKTLPSYENVVEKGEIVVKKWDFRGKKWVIGS